MNIRSFIVLASFLGIGFGFSVALPTAQAACVQTGLSATAFGQSGAAVSTLQQCLIDAGYAIPAGPTGYYGSQTQTAVQAFYTKVLNMPAWDGRSVGPQGRAALATASTGSGESTPVVPAPTLATLPGTGRCDTSTIASATYGAQGASVTTLQNCLINAGFSIPAGASGYYGGQTQAAVQALYRSTLGIPSWHGKWVGPQGRQVLATTPNTGGASTGSTVRARYKRVASEAELRTYIAEQNAGSGFLRMGMGAALGVDGAVPPMAPSPTSAQAESTAATRVSTTNVQVAGIDEPDIVKTDGQHLFVSEQGRYYGGPMPLPMQGGGVAVGAPGVTNSATVAPAPPGDTTAIMPDYRRGTTKVIDALPLEDLAVLSKDIEETGELLLSGTTLMVFAGDRVTAYDVHNPAKPQKAWTHQFDERARLQTARLKDGTVYLVTATYLSTINPCPPMPLRDTGIAFPCTSVWVPTVLEPVDTSYTILALNPTTGTVGKSVTIAGSSQNTVVSLFEDNVYVATASQHNATDVTLDFYLTELNDYLDNAARARIQLLKSYDISASSKLSEIEQLLQKVTANMSQDERLRFETERQNRLQKYMTAHARDIDRTTLTRVALADLTLSASASIPGHLLNQFSLDEYEGYLRVAVTVGNRWSTFGNTMNDVYVLAANTLSVQGSVRDLGLTEQVYAVRFINDRGYLVTFRQVDPFYVLDLSEPSSPRMVGELKIPGYSSYLEALDGDTVLGVGRDGNSVKLSLFDVSNPGRPVERDTYTLSEFWTEVEGNHHAFLRDSDHKVVFIPASQGGYVISYAGNVLSLKASVGGYSVKRAVYLNDYLYVIGESEITVLDENTWKEAAKLTL